MVGRGDETASDRTDVIQELEAEMLAAAESLDFERAAQLRDQIYRLREADGGAANQSTASAEPVGGRPRAGRGRRRVPRPKRR
jgi:excinuclease ABC subunit B